MIDDEDKDYIDLIKEKQSRFKREFEVKLTQDSLLSEYSAAPSVAKRIPVEDPFAEIEEIDNVLQ